MSGATRPLAIWNCQTRALEIPLDELTVGDPFALECSGDAIAPLGPGTKIGFVEAEDAYRLHLLQVEESTATGFRGVVTSYKPGVWEKKEFTVTDGSSGFYADGEGLQVKSVIDPQSPPDGFFGPWGAVPVVVPWWTWGLLAVAVVGLAGGIWLGLRRWTLQRQLEMEMGDNRTPLRPFFEHRSPLIDCLNMLPVPALSPLNQMSKDYRKLARFYGQARQGEGAVCSSQDMVRALEEVFRTYLVREFHVPAHRWNDSQVCARLARKHRRFWRDEGRSVENLFKELRRMRSAAKNFNADEYEQIADAATALAARVDRRKRETVG
jgi:hypothetical protein